MVLKAVGKWFSGQVQERRSNECIEQMLVRFVCKERDTPGFSIVMR